MARSNCSAWLIGLLSAACGGTTSTTDGTAGESTGATAGGSTGAVDDSTSSVGTQGGESTSGVTEGGEASSGGTTGGLPPIELLSLEIAQTHALPDGERTWALRGTEYSLHVVGGRSLLALVELGGQVPGPAIEAWVGDELLGSVPLDPPSALPPTEAGGPIYRENVYSATVDAAWVRPGLALRAAADGFAPSASKPLPVGVDSEFDMWTLPFYLFGADDDNSIPIAETAKPDEVSAAELIAKWPIARVNFAQHPAGRVDWPYIVVGPRDGGPAMRVDDKDEQKDGFAVMSAVLGVLGALRDANGEGGTNNHYYAPLMMLTAQGEYESPGGGLGGGSLGTGDHVYAGIFIHEQGHAFGMPHAGDAFTDGSYPYIGGSLLGSTWGYDAGRREFLAPFMPPGAEHAGDCLTDGGHQIDDEGRCVKQDPMQGGSGDQAPGYRYTMFSDFNAGKIQRYFEGETTLDDDGAHVFDGGVMFVDAASSTGYSRWDGIDGRRVEVAVETVDNGLYGFDRGLPDVRGVPVHAIVFTISRAGDPEASQIYPPLAFQGNLRRQVDPTAPDELAQIVPNTSDVPWYCHASGCDYTLRVTYADQSVRHVLIRGGFRPWFDPEGAPAASTTDPASGDSFRVFAVNVPGEEALSEIEVLDTPMGWNGAPDDAPVVLSRSL
jgi:hypothetical protein